MGGLSSQPRTDPAMSPINAFLVEDLYTPEFLESLQENTGYWQEPNPHEYPVEQVATSPTKKKKSTRNRQKRTIQSDDAPRQIAWTTEEEIALAKAVRKIEDGALGHDLLLWSVWLFFCGVCDIQGASNAEDDVFVLPDLILVPKLGSSLSLTCSGTIVVYDVLD
ncbi:hypothetical protein Tco_0837414 [Tanacetum coccineum]